MKAAISYKCACGQEYLVCVHRNEPEDVVADWRRTVAGIAEQGGPPEVGGQAVERVDILVDDDDVVVQLHRLGKTRADAATAHDDDVHASFL